MYGLGKPRTKFGKWLDSQGIKQGELPVHRHTAASLCNDKDYEPYEDTVIKVISFLRKNGYDVRLGDFW